MRNLLTLIFLGSLAIVAGCGGGSGSNSSSSSSGNNSGSTPPSGANVQPVSVNSGPTGGYVNGIFTSVVVCVPGKTDSASCPTISNVLVDTGSFGLRILSSAISAPLPQQVDVNNHPIAECAFFADSVTWGSVKTADIKLSGEMASSVPVQVIGDPSFSTVPDSCLKHAPSKQASDNLSLLMANGILGIGQFLQDCGPACALPLTATNPGNPGNYYVCPTASSCTVTVEPPNMQLQNPVGMFAVDNNGSILELPAIAATGAPSVNGSLIFGIGTQSNNALGSAKVFTPDPNTGNLTTIYPPGGTTYPNSVIDSGSNGLFFGSATASLPLCPSNNSTPSGFYCPSTTQNLSAVQQGHNGTTNTVNFSVANPNQPPLSNNFALDDLAGPTSDSTSFDWGLPFFFGRNVFTGIQSQSNPVGYWAY